LTDGIPQVEFSREAVENLVSVVIPVYQDVPGLADTLDSLERQTLPPTEYEIIVSNDGGDPEVSALCEARGVTEVPIVPNRGSYFARNRGIERAAGEYLAFVDADIVVPEDWLAVGRDALRAADYVGGPVRVDEVRATTPAERYEAATGFRGNTPDIRHGFFVTANLFVKRKVFERLGGFDERLRSGGDNEFGRRVARVAEYRQRFEEGLAVLHPPRGYRALVRKAVRVAQGKEMLNRLHPERYHYARPGLGRLVLNVVVPPDPRKVRRTFEPNPHFGFLAFYLFRWRFRVEVSLRLAWMYYGRGPELA
jgi:glycosyltransferase AglI